MSSAFQAEATIGRPVKVLDITGEEQAELKRWLRSRQIPAAEQQRARIILLSILERSLVSASE